MLLYQVNQRLNEIFRSSDQLPFTGMSVIVCDDFYQLPPVKGLPVYSSTTIKCFLTLDLWHKFKMAEMTEVMRQRDDYQIINIFNKIWEGKIDEDVELTLKLRFFKKLSYPENAVHIFAEKKPVEQHNEIKLDKIASELVRIQAIDKTQKHIKLTESQIEPIIQRKIRETGNLTH